MCQGDLLAVEQAHGQDQRISGSDAQVQRAIAGGNLHIEQEPHAWAGLLAIQLAVTGLHMLHYVLWVEQVEIQFVDPGLADLQGALHG